MKRNRTEERGFALLMVVIIVALIAIMAAALLDQVQVDLVSVGEHRRTLEAKGNAQGAMGEVLTDPRLDLFMPHPMSGLAASYMSFDGTNYIYDGSGVGPGTQVANSAYVTDAGTNVHNGYVANLGFLRRSHATESAIGTVVHLVYEVDVESSISTGRATGEARTEISRPVVRPDGALWNRFSPIR